MSRQIRVLPAVLVAGIALLVGASATVLRAQDRPTDQIPFGASQIFFEFNSSAQDLGVQVFLDGESWKELVIVDPNGNILLDVRGKGNVKMLGLTELFFESTEPSFDELSFDEILALFPEGTYHFFGVTVEGRAQVGTSTLTHDIPDGPVILSPGPGQLVDRNNTVISWAPVTTPAGIRISRYQIIVEQPHGERVLSVDVPARATSVTVPKEFLKPGTRYIFEVLAKEVSGNQTITEGSFATR
jgi:Fibronectin type III domain